jgi:hypothetical protein
MCHRPFRCVCSVRVLRFLGLVTLLALAGPTAAQPPPAFPPPPRLLLVTPCGGQAGVAVEVAVTGTDLEDATGLLFDDPGIRAELIAPAPPPNPRQPAPKTVTARFRVTIPAQAALGLHDLRVVGPGGVSNPRAFVVGDLPEAVEQEPNNDVGQAQRIPLNGTVHGTITTPTDVDYYVFAGKKGQRVVVSCLASSIDSRLTPALHLYTRDGAPLAFNRDYHGTDAVLDAVLPDDGDYYVRVFAFTYTAGSPEHFYRLTVSTAPWIDAVFPPVVEPGKETAVTVYGRNLPGGRPDPAAVLDGRVLEKITVTVRAPDAAGRLDYAGHVGPASSGLDGFTFRVRNAAGFSNPYLLTLAQAPVVLENQPNDTPETAQTVPVPCEIAGRVEKVRDRDWYRFEAKKGDVLSLEAYGDRLGSPLDLYFTLRPEGGRGPVQEFDDNPEVLHPLMFFSRTEDPARQRFVAPADGFYLVQVSSREADIQAGPRHQYRLRITAERPDFRLIVLPPAVTGPDAVVLGAGGAQVYTVLVWRQDGFEGPITLRAEGLPPGCSCPPQVVNPGQRQAALVVVAEPGAAPWTGFITAKGAATIGGREVERPARPASLTWPVPQGQIGVSRLDRGLALAVRGEAPLALAAAADRLAALAGDRVTVQVKLRRLWPDLKGPVQVSAVGLPAGALLAFNGGQPLTFNPGRDEASATLNLGAALPPGTYCLILRAQSVVTLRDAAGRQRPNVAVSGAAVPLTLTVLPKTVAEVALAPAVPRLKPGGEVEVRVQVKRLHGYAGPFRVQLVTPPDARGFSAEEVVIPAGEDEGKLIVKAAANVPQGQRGLVVRVTATVRDVLTTQEAKLTLNVAK